MIQLSIDEVTPGMVVARSVLGGASGVQLAAGYVLDEGVIQRCKRQQMRTMWVHLDGDDTGSVNFGFVDNCTPPKGGRTKYFARTNAVRSAVVKISR